VKAFTTGFFQGLTSAINLEVYGLGFFLAAVLYEKVEEMNP
jgi:hypothetical protein